MNTMSKGVSTYTNTLDYFCLLLCMAVGHCIVGNPLFGAAVFLFADIIKKFLFSNVSSFRHVNNARYVSNIALAAVILLGMVTTFVYPFLIDEPKAMYISVFAIILVVRNSIGAVSTTEVRMSRSFGYYLSTLIAHLLLDVGLVWFLWKNMSGAALGFSLAVIVVTGLSKLWSPDVYIASSPSVTRNEYENIGSYRIFTDMNLYSTMAINLGVMDLFMYVLRDSEFDVELYLRLSVMLLIVGGVLILTSFFINKRTAPIAITEAVLGIVIWICGDLLLFFETPFYLYLLPILWGVAVALVASAVRLFITDFQLLGKALDDGYDYARYSYSTVTMLAYSSIASSVIMLVLIGVKLFLVPQRVMRLFDFFAMQLPGLFMIVALVLAIRQPFDRRNREKLMLYIENNSKSPKIRESLKRILVAPYRKPLGVKLMTFFARPFLRFKVTGKKNLSKKDYPSVFVCNHSFILGPIAAVIYIPTFFRPWIHDVMLKPETAEKEMNVSLKFLFRVFGKKIGGAIIKTLAKAACKVMNTYDPIPVSRGASKNVMSTFDESLEALENGDNILLFPEHPIDRSKGAQPVDANDLRSFYTGFAHIGKMYFDHTGRELLFYPMYTSMEKRCFRIGEPIKYDSSLDSRESKLSLAAALQESISGLEAM